MPKLNSRDGFALPMALLVMVVLTAGIAAGFAATSAEVITNASHRGDNRAYNLAEAGLEQFMANRKEGAYCDSSFVAGVKTANLCLADPAASNASQVEYKRIDLTGGYANITATLVRVYAADTIPAIFLIRAVGVDKSVKLTGATMSDSGARAVGMLAAWSKSVVNVKGAWYAMSGLHKNGNAGLIDGHDQCTLADGGGQPTLPGAVVPSGGQFTGDPDPFSGSPPIDTSKTFDQLKNDTKLDWAGILNGSIEADFYVPSPDAFPDASWFSTHPNDWPTIRVHATSFTLPNEGRGMIIADGDFTINGSNMWDGIVLIGGKLTSNGNNTTAGATMSGLNYLIDGTSPGASSDDSDANGQKTYVYNSCNVEKASKGLQQYRTMTNTYMDQISVW
jgi:Tfp pilus assembly protein PilX